MRKPTKFGKYLLLDRIAVGGMAEVFVAKAFGVEGFERLLAIKKILPTMGEDPEFISMFVDEARIAVQLSHANIVQILELGKHDENLYIAMEYIAGRDVRQVLERFRKKGRPMPVPVACLVIAKVCEALDYAHRKLDARGMPLGIVHRDVSPQNVLVSYDGDVKLIDFGIAKAESRLQKTQAGILKGKFSYMSPEQVRGQPIDHRSDVFAVGVVLWELLTGEKLFTGESDFAVLEKVRQGLVPPPRQLNPAIPEALQTVVMKALKAEVAERYQWASELHDDLMRFCLVGDMVYGSRQLAEWLREEFSAEAEREQERLRVWMSASVDALEVTPPSRTAQELALKTDPDPRPAAVEVKPERKSPPTVHDRPSTPVMPVARGASAMSTAPELPSLKAALSASSPTPPANDPASRSGEFRVPRDADTLAAPPTPPGGSAKVSIFSKNDPALLDALAKTPAAALSLQELPTMKMDGDVLAAAEKALLEREAEAKKAAQARPSFGKDDDPTASVTPTGAPSMKKTVPEGVRVSQSGDGVFAAMVASSLPPPPAAPARSNGASGVHVEVKQKAVLGGSSGSPSAATVPESRAAVPAVPQPPAGVTTADTVRKAVPFGFYDEPTRTLPIQAPKPEEQAAQARREQVKAEKRTADVEAKSVPWIVLAGLALGVVGLVALYTALRPGERPTGTLVVSVKPSVPAEVFLDGRPVGSAPWVGRGVVAGPRRLEVRAAGYKTESRTVTVKGDPRPMEVAVELISDAPAPLVAPDVVLNGRKRAEETRPAVERGPPPAPAEAAKAAEPPKAAAEPSRPPPAPPAADPTKRPKAEAPKSAAVAAPEPSDEPVAEATSAGGPPPKLKITTDPPGASVVVDGKTYGKSPVVIPDLDPSHYHAVAATLDGYAPGRRAAKLEQTGTTLMHLILMPKPSEEARKPAAQPARTASTGGGADDTVPAVGGAMGYLIAATSPVARVSVDGRDTGRWTPVPPANPIALPAGDHKVVFTTAAGKTIEYSVTIEAGKTKSVIKRLD